MHVFAHLAAAPIWFQIQHVQLFCVKKTKENTGVHFVFVGGSSQATETSTALACVACQKRRSQVWLQWERVWVPLKMVNLFLGIV